MAPIRRYLRITKYSVLEVRIYLDKPSDASWLLSTREPVLPRIMEEVRPKVLPKLREENELAKKKGGKKKKGIKDTASQEDFEVTIFLTELSTRHSLLTKQKVFKEKPRLQSTGNKLTGWLGGSREKGIVVEDDVVAEILREEDVDEDVVELRDVPEVGASGKRKANVAGAEDDALFVSSDDEEFFHTQRETGRKRKKGQSAAAADDTAANDDKKKMALNTSYDGFSIYGRILCLVVKRKGKKAGPSAPVGGSQMMEQWVSTQAAQDAGLDEDEDG